MAELNIEMILNPIYNLATPLSYALGDPVDNNSYGIIGGPYVNFDAAAINMTLNQAGVINIDNYNKNYSQTAIPLYSYEHLSTVMASDFDLMTANHNMVNEQLNGATLSKNVLSCSAVAKIGVKDFTKFVNRACLKSTKPNSSMVFCTLAVAMNENIINKSTEVIVYAGCKYVVKKVKEDLVEIYFEWEKELENDLKDIALWLSFVNSTEGMMWLSNEINKQ